MLPFETLHTITLVGPISIAGNLYKHLQDLSLSYILKAERNVERMVI